MTGTIGTPAPDQVVELTFAQVQAALTQLGIAELPPVVNVPLGRDAAEGEGVPPDATPILHALRQPDLVVAVRRKHVHEAVAGRFRIDRAALVGHAGSWTFLERQPNTLRISSVADAANAITRWLGECESVPLDGASVDPVGLAAAFDATPARRRRELASSGLTIRDARTIAAALDSGITETSIVAAARTGDRLIRRDRCVAVFDSARGRFVTVTDGLPLTRWTSVMSCDSRQLGQLVRSTIMLDERAP